MTDVCILGGGLVGGLCAIALSRQGLKVEVVDREAQSEMLHPRNDGRTTAVNLASKHIFEELGLWETLSAYAEPILDIKVFETGSPWSIHFDHKMVGEEPMGYIIENRFIRQAIIQTALQCSSLTWHENTTLAEKKVRNTKVDLLLSNGQHLHASLLVGAEGRTSPTRQEAGIKSYHFPYHQKALVFSVYHDKPHQGIAWEAFHPQGPLAFLPLQNCPDTDRHRSGVVWTLSPNVADEWKEKDNKTIAAHLYELFNFLGIFEIVGEKWCYPLAAQMVNRFIDKRFVIIGDAAHVCHPVAGQGVNVGWRDAIVLAKHLGQAKALGLDIGSYQILTNYQKERRLDTWSVFAMTDGMVRLFSNNSSLLYFLRNVGLGAVNRMPPIKKFFMRRAMGFDS